MPVRHFSSMSNLINRSIAPELHEIGNIHILEAIASKLDNGIPVYRINAGYQELVKVELIFVNTAFDPAQPLLQSAANRMLSEGTTRHTAQQLADSVDYFGAFYETEENADYCSVNLYTLNKYLANTLPYLREIISEAIYPEQELNVYKQNNKQRLIVENEKVGSVARRKFNEILFGGKHPYGYFTQPDDFDKLNRNALREHQKNQYVSDRCRIVVSGKVGEETLQLLNQFLGDKNWSGSLEKKEPAAVMTYTGSRQQFLPKEGAVQSAIRIGRRMFNRTHADYPGMAVLNTVLGGYFGSRLMSNIREDKGYTYGIGSAMVSLREEGYFFISTEVGADVTGAALEEIYKEIELLKTEPVDEEELEMVRNYMLGTFIKGVDGAFQLADRFKAIHMHGLDYSYFQRYLEKIRTIEPDEIMQLANKYLVSTAFYELVVGHK